MPDDNFEAVSAMARIKDQNHKESQMTREEMIETGKRLAAPFLPGQVSFKPQSVKNNMALAVAFIDARDVAARLDEAVGWWNWWARYEILGPDASVICYLTVMAGDREVTKTDVGNPSDQPNAGDRLKAAHSDALKRAAVHFGIGRSLYSLPLSWFPYDSGRKQFVSEPTLPKWYTDGHAGPASIPVPQRQAPAPAAPKVETPKANLPKVGEKEMSELDKLITVSGTKPDKFFEAYNVTSLSGMTMADYHDAVPKLKIRSQERMAAAGQNQTSPVGATS